MRLAGRRIYNNNQNETWIEGSACLCEAALEAPSRHASHHGGIPGSRRRGSGRFHNHRRLRAAMPEQLLPPSPPLLPPPASSLRKRLCLDAMQQWRRMDGPGERPRPAPVTSSCWMDDSASMETMSPATDTSPPSISALLNGVLEHFTGTLPAGLSADATGLVELGKAEAPILSHRRTSNP